MAMKYDGERKLETLDIQNVFISLQIIRILWQNSDSELSCVSAMSTIPVKAKGIAWNKQHSIIK